MREKSKIAWFVYCGSTGIAEIEYVSSTNHWVKLLNGKSKRRGEVYFAKTEAIEQCMRNVPFQISSLAIKTRRLCQQYHNLEKELFELRREDVDEGEN
jgi:16S rRNA U1498 N3-methylase RsmE